MSEKNLNYDDDDEFQHLLNEKIQEEADELIEEYGDEIDSAAAAFNAGWNYDPPNNNDEDESCEEDDENEEDAQLCNL